MEDDQGLPPGQDDADQDGDGDHEMMPPVPHDAEPDADDDDDDSVACDGCQGCPLYRKQT